MTKARVLFTALKAPRRPGMLRKVSVFNTPLAEVVCRVGMGNASGMGDV